MFRPKQALKIIALASFLVLCSYTFLEAVKHHGPLSAVDNLNRYIALLNAGHDNVHAFEDSLAELESKPNENFTCTFDYNNTDANLDYDVKNPGGLSAEETANLSTQGTAILSTLNQLKTLCENLANKANSLTRNQNISDAKSLIKNYYAAHNILLNDVNAAFKNYYAWTPDPSDPVSLGIDNMDNDLAKAKDILDMVNSNFITGTTDGIGLKLQTLYEPLATLASEHGTQVTSDAVSENYHGFYEQLNKTFLPAVKNSIDDFNAANMNGINLDYYTLLDSYNLMTDWYNQYVDASGY